MTRENFLTVRWNNLLSLGLGLIVLAYIVAVSSLSLWADQGGFTGLVVIGACF